MSNIIILVGSMRKGGNTDLLAQAFAEGARKNNSVEIVSVADYKVSPCIGCNSCFTREGNKCFQNDDMDRIYQLVLNFFHLEDVGMVLVRGVKDKGDIKGNVALKEAYDLGLSVK